MLLPRAASGADLGAPVLIVAADLDGDGITNEYDDDMDGDVLPEPRGPVVADGDRHHRPARLPVRGDRLLSFGFVGAAGPVAPTMLLEPCDQPRG
jgi:hypothetical protein